MINKIGYGDNKTAFGMHFIPDKHNYYEKLFNITVSAIKDNEKFEKIIKSAETLRKLHPEHKLEIISLREGDPKHYVAITNHATGATAQFETTGKLAEFLPKIVDDLLIMARRKTVFFDEKTKSARLHRLLTGQKIKVDFVI